MVRALALLVVSIAALAPGLVRAQSPSGLAAARAALDAAHLDEAEVALESASRATHAPEVERALALAWSDLGDARYHRGEPDRAVRAYARALVIAPDDARLHVCRGWALDASGHDDDARDEIAAARALDPSSVAARALEQHMDEAASVRAGLTIAGGTAIGVGAALAITASIAGAVLRQQMALGPSDGTTFDWLVGTGIVVALSGIVLAILGETLHVGSTALPPRTPLPLVVGLDGGAWLGLATTL